MHEVEDRHDDAPHFCAACLLADGTEATEVFCLTCEEWFCLRHRHHHHPNRRSPIITLGTPTEPTDNQE